MGGTPSSDVYVIPPHVPHGATASGDAGSRVGEWLTVESSGDVSEMNVQRPTDVPGSPGTANRRSPCSYSLTPRCPRSTSRRIVDWRVISSASAQSAPRQARGLSGMKLGRLWPKRYYRPSDSLQSCGACNLFSAGFRLQLLLEVNQPLCQVDKLG